MATTDNIQPTPEAPKTANQPEARKASAAPAYRKSTLAWLSLIVTIAAWIALWSDGYVALAIAAVGLILGFCGIAHRRPLAKRIAITSIIASLVLIVVVAAYLMVLKIGLGV